MLCFVPVLRGCVWHVFCYVRKKGILQCLCNYGKERYGPVSGTLAMSLLDFWMGTLLANFHMVLCCCYEPF